MQNLDKITDKIKSDADSRKERILADAERSFDEIIKNAESRAEKMLAKAKNRSRREALEVAKRAYSTADMRERELMLATRVGLINKAFREARRRLLQLSDDDYCSLAAHLLADAATERIEAAKRLKKTYGDSEDCCVDFEVLFRKEDLEERAPLIIKAAKAVMRTKSATLGRTPFAISEEVADIDGGVILRYGDIETNCSFEAVISDARERLEGRVAEILFSPASLSGEDAYEDSKDSNDNNNEE